MPPEMLLQTLQYQQLPGENNHSTTPVVPPTAADVTVLERQVARLQWRQQQQQHGHSLAGAVAASDSLLVPTPYYLPQPPHILQTAILCGEQGTISCHDVLSGGSAAGAWPDLAHYGTFLCNSGAADQGVLGGGGGATARSSTSFGSPPFMSGNVECSGRVLSPVPASQLEHASTAKQGGPAAAAAGVPAFSTVDGARESSRKRKSTEIFNNITHEVEDDEYRVKKMIKAENTETAPVEPKVESPASTVIATTNFCKEISSNINRDTSSGASCREKKKSPEPLPKTDYIHVRARRGQATDSHSLAERVRREKISERMKLLQGLVPGCNKITGKAGMLDEIINYVQSLQRQVEFLSMKLAAVTPALDFNLDAFLTKEMSTLAGACGIPPPQMGLIPELLGLSFVHQLNPLQQQAMASVAAAAECCSLPVPMVNSSCNSAQEALCRGVAGAVPVSVAPQLATSAGWEGELQSFYASTLMERFEQGSPASPSTFQPLISPR